MTDILVSLVFDSRTEPTPELRSRRIEDRHLIYEGGGVVLDLLLKRSGDGSCLHVGGQVLPDGDSLDEVADLSVMLKNNKHRWSTHTNAFGEFMFQAVPDGTFDIEITLKNLRFRVRGLSNKEPRMWRVVHSMAVGGH